MDDNRALTKEMLIEYADILLSTFIRYVHEVYDFNVITKRDLLEVMRDAKEDIMKGILEDGNDS